MRRTLLWAGNAFVVVAAVALLAMKQETVASPEELQKNPEAVLEGYRHVEAASVSDAAEQVLHEKRYMSHKMQAIFPTKFVGTALTVQLLKQENNDPNALQGMLQAIDSGGKDSVYVMQVQDGADIAGMGGLMGTAMWSRGFSGAVIDGGVRDLPQLKRIGFPVYATGVVPSTSVSHYRFGGMNVPVVCDGVKVNPGDIISADQDGVVVIPKDKAVEVLIRAQKLDQTEHAMYPYIEKLHSIVAAVKEFGRI
ncbi:RraA family protein [Terriglobus albidus]|uniref:Putative 4-hydroxy-4-methyl-2-oxoglutarate aldolase n=2 Tax=Terriglobus albidus TaxID=1592106 RepID=A0A5B9EGM3_9BACT|nr:RraA family protein [Terriglobus albidus]